jgi:hypothetical protein
MLLSGDERGRPYLEETLNLRRSGEFGDYVALAYGNLGSIAGEHYQFTLASRYLTDGLAYCVDHDLDRARLYLLSWLVLTYMYQGRWDDAT